MQYKREKSGQTTKSFFLFPAAQTTLRIRIFYYVTYVKFVLLVCFTVQNKAFVSILEATEKVS
jgi:hypothetical protein